MSDNSSDKLEKQATITQVVAHILKALAQALDTALEEHLGRRLGFCIIVFAPGAGLNVSSYIANTDRDVTIQGLREMADQLEKKTKSPPMDERH